MSINNFLVVSRASPFSKSGSGEVANQFLSFFSKDEIVFLCEKNNGISVDSEQIHYVNLYPINIRRGKRFIRWQRWFLLPSLVNKIVSLAINENSKSIMCFYPDEIYLIASSIAAKKLGIPIYPYFHNLFFENKSGIPALLARFVQKRIFTQAPWVYLISKGLLNEIAKGYPNTDFRVLTHTASIQEDLSQYSSNLKNVKTKFTFLGHINNSNIDSMSYILNAIGRRDDFIVELITQNSIHFLKKNQLIKKNTLINNNVSDEALLGKLKASDILLLPHGMDGPLSHAEYQSAFPTKTIKYLQSGTPILAVLPLNCYLHDFLAKNQCAFCLSTKNEQEFYSAIEKILNNSNSKIKNNAEQVVKEFSQHRVLQKLRQEIFV